MNRAVLLVAASIALLAAAAAAQPRPSDIEGWDQVKWGMTLAQVRELYPGAKPSKNEYWSHLGLPAIRVGEIPLEVSVGARNPSPRVSLISLWCYYGLPAATVGAAPQITAGDFETLKTALFRKYGSPRDELRTTEYGDAVHSYLWVFPSGSITLKLAQGIRTPQLGSFRVEYRAAEKAPI